MLTSDREAALSRSWPLRRCNKLGDLLYKLQRLLCLHPVARVERDMLCMGEKGVADGLVFPVEIPARRRQSHIMTYSRSIAQLTCSLRP